MSVFAQMPRTMIIIQSPNIETVWPAEEQAEVLAVRAARLHRYDARKTRKSPLTVLPRTTSVGP